MQMILQGLAFKTTGLIHSCDCHYSGMVKIVVSQLITHIGRSLTQALPLVLKLTGLMHLCGQFCQLINHTPFTDL